MGRISRAIVPNAQWNKNKEFKKPIYYAIGHGELTDEEAETWDEEKGQLTFLRRLDMGDLMVLGIADEMDFMTKGLMAPEEKPKEDQTPKDAVKEVVEKAKSLPKMQRMINAVVHAGMIEPKTWTVPEHEAARQPGLLYIDEVPWEHRMELFSFIFEAEGLSTFREEQTDSVGDLADVPSVPLPPDGPLALRSDDSEGVLLQSGSVSLREESGIGDESSGESEPQEQEAGARS